VKRRSGGLFPLIPLVNRVLGHDRNLDCKVWGSDQKRNSERAKGGVYPGVVRGNANKLVTV